MQNPIEQIADEILVLDAQSGRCEAFEMLVARWQKRLWAHAFTMTGRPDAAWDITQESWLNIVRGLGRLKDPDKFGAWAYRIVSNKAKDWLARNSRGISSEIQPECEPGEMQEPAVEPAQRETVSDVHSILRWLPGHSQVVLKLCYLEGFNLVEISEILGIPEGTVKSRLHTARLEFKKNWEALAGMSPSPVPASGKERQHEQ